MNKEPIYCTHGRPEGQMCPHCLGVNRTEAMLDMVLTNGRYRLMSNKEPKKCKNCGKDLDDHPYKSEHGSLIPYCENLKDKFINKEPKEKRECEICGKLCNLVGNTRDTIFCCAECYQIKEKALEEFALKEDRKRIREELKQEILSVIERGKWDTPNALLDIHNAILSTIKDKIDNI